MEVKMKAKSFLAVLFLVAFVSAQAAYAGGSCGGGSYGEDKVVQDNQK